MAKRSDDLLLRGSVYHVNIRTPTDIMQAFPEEKAHFRKSLGTTSFYEAKHLAALVRKKLEDRWAGMRTEEEDAVAAAIRREKEAVEAFGEVPWPRLAETMGEKLERLASRLGVLEEFHEADTLEDLPEKLSENIEGKKLLHDIKRAKGDLTWTQAGEEFLREGTVKASTGRTYASQWALADEADVPGPQQITREHARDYLRKRRDAGASGSTLNGVVTAMSALMEHLYPDNEQKAELWKRLRVKPKAEARGKKRRDIQLEELEPLLKGLHWTVVIATKLSCYTGLRVNELYEADWDLEAMTATIKEGKTVNSSRTIPLHSHIRDDVRRWTTDRTRQVKNTLVTMFSRNKLKLGYGSELTFHSTRHAFASALSRAGVSEERRELLCGHQRRGMQGRYAHLAVEDLRPDVERIDWSLVNWNGLMEAARE